MNPNDWSPIGLQTLRDERTRAFERFCAWRDEAEGRDASDALVRERYDEMVESFHRRYAEVYALTVQPTDLSLVRQYGSGVLSSNPRPEHYEYLLLEKGEQVASCVSVEAAKSLASMLERITRGSPHLAWTHLLEACSVEACSEKHAPPSWTSGDWLIREQLKVTS